MKEKQSLTSWKQWKIINGYSVKKTYLLPTSGTQKAIPHPLGSSRSHPAPQEFISCPTCLPGWWTSRMGTRPCSGVGLSLEPGTSTSLLIRFNSWRQKIPELAVTSTNNFESLDREKKLNKQLCDISGNRDLLRYLVFGDIVAHRLLPQVTLTAVFRYTSQHHLPPLLLVHLWNKQPTLRTLGWAESTESERRIWFRSLCDTGRGSNNFKNEPQNGNFAVGGHVV